MLPKNYCVPKSETPELSTRQRDVLSFVLREWSQGCPPTLRMIGNELGIGSPNGVFCHIRALRKKGYLRSDRETRSCVAPSMKAVALAVERLLSMVESQGKERGASDERRGIAS